MEWDTALRRTWGTAVALGAMAVVPSYAMSEPAEPQIPRPHIIFTIDVDRISESSALVDSTAHPGLVYTANDSGDGPYVYALNQEGELVGTTTLVGVDPVDIEAMAAGDDGSLVVADIGDNAGVRGSVQVYRIPQPAAGNRRVTPDTVALHYAGGPRDAESVLYDAANERIFVVSKEVLAHVFASTPAVFDKATAILRPLASAPILATDAALLPGGSQAVIRTYGAATVFRYPSWAPVTTFSLPVATQGESISGVPGHEQVWVGSEGVNSPVWSVPLPPDAVPSTRPRAPTTSAPTMRGKPAQPTPPTEGALVAEGGKGGGLSIVAVSTSASVLVLAVGAVLLLSRNRRPSTKIRQ